MGVLDTGGGNAGGGTTDPGNNGSTGGDAGYASCTRPDWMRNTRGIDYEPLTGALG